MHDSDEPGPRAATGPKPAPPHDGPVPTRQAEEKIAHRLPGLTHAASPFIGGFDMPGQILMEGIALDAEPEICHSPALPHAPQTTLRLLWRLGFFGDANLNPRASWERAQSAGWLQGMREALAAPRESRLPARLLVRELQDAIPEALTELQWKRLQSLLARPTGPKQVIRVLKAYHEGLFVGLKGLRMWRCVRHIRRYLACQAALEAHEQIEKQTVMPAIDALASAMHWLEDTPASLNRAIERGVALLLSPDLKAASLKETLLEAGLLHDEGDVPLSREQAEKVLQAVACLKHAHRLQLLADVAQDWLNRQEPALPPDWTMLSQRIRCLAAPFEQIPMRDVACPGLQFLMNARAISSGLLRLLADAPDGLAQGRRLLIVETLAANTQPVVEWGYLQALDLLRAPILDGVEHIVRVRESLGHVLLRRFARIDHGRSLAPHTVPGQVRNFSTFLLTHLTYARQALRIPNRQWRAAEEWFLRAGADSKVADQIIFAAVTEQMTLERLRAFDNVPMPASRLPEARAERPSLHSLGTATAPFATLGVQLTNGRK